MRKKLLSILLVLSLMLALVPAAFAADEVWSSGTCGKEGDGSSVTWTLYKSGLLTFTGTGAIRDYASSAPPWRYSAVTVVVGEGITRLGAYMLAGSTVTSVSLPSTLTDVDTQALNGCRYLTGITFPDGVKTIGEQALSNCTSLTSVTLPASVETIGDRAFMGCTMLASVTIPEGPTHLGTNLFRGDWELKSILLPQSLTQLDESVFSSCGIETITIPDNVTVIGKKAFFASGLTDISIPAGVTDIGDRAFSQTRLTSVTVPATIRSFGKYIFSECVDLHTAVLAEGITRVSDGMFRDCTNLADVTLPQTLTAIARQAFSGCTDLEHIALPETTVKYGACAFSGTYLTDVRFPAGTSYLGKGVLSNMPVLQQITLPDGLTSVGAELFLGDKELKEVTLPSGLTAVSDSMFSGCTALQSIDLPDTVAYIGESAFSGCTSLTEAALPAKLKTLGLSAFSGCGITSIAFPDGISEIPAGVTMNCTSLERVTIPDGVTAIGDAAFSGCVHLREVTIPERVTTIGAYAFFDCNSLTCVRIPAAVAEIGEGAFASCARLRTVEVADGNPAFSVAGGVLVSADHTRLLAYPNGRAGVDYVVPASVTAMDAHAFQGCRLVSITLPDGLKVIPEEAFADSAHLVRIWIPLSVKEIDTDVFQRCPELKYVLYEGTEDDWVYIFQPGITGLDSDYLYVEAPRLDDSAADVFCDVDSTSWSYDGIEFCYMSGLMSGVGGDVFSPHGVTTRAQIVQILYNLSGEPSVSGGCPFTDLTADWYRDAITWAYQTGVVAGTSDTTFSPDLPVTREQIAVILMEYAAKVLELTNGGEKADLAAFPDGGQVSDWARDAMADAVALGLISGAQTKDGTLLLPQNSATREQVATILMEFYTSIDNALIDVTTA